MKSTEILEKQIEINQHELKDKNWKLIPIFEFKEQINRKSDLDKFFEKVFYNFFKNWNDLIEILIKYKREDFLLTFNYFGYEFYLKIKVKFNLSSLKVNHLWLEEIIYWNTVFRNVNWKGQFVSKDVYAPKDGLFKDIYFSFINIQKNLKNKWSLQKNLNIKNQRLPYKD